MTLAPRTACLALVLLALALTAGGIRADEDDRTTLSYEGPLPIERLIQQVGDALDLPLVWDPKSRALQNKEITGEVRLAGTREEILEGLRSLLTFYELVLVPVGSPPNQRLLIMDARQTAAIVKLKPRYVEFNDGNLEEYADKDGLFVTTTIRVENMDSLRDARNALNRIVTGQNIGNVTEVPTARAFVVTDFAPNVVAIYRLLREMDVPFEARGPEAAGTEETFEAVRLKHAKAKDVAAVLVAQFAANGPADPRAQRGAQQAPEVPPRPALRITPDERLNQVLISGMRRDVDRVRVALVALDQPAAPMSTQVQVIRLEHINALGAAAALNQLIRRYPGPWMVGPGVSDLPAVEPHQETNSLLLHATDAAATVLRRVITEMDREVDADDE